MGSIAPSTAHQATLDLRPGAPLSMTNTGTHQRVAASNAARVAPGTAVAFKVGANGTAFSSTNPSYSGSAVLLSYTPIGGKVGDGLAAPVSFVVNGTITQGTS